MVIYGYINEDGYLTSKVIEPEISKLKNAEGEFIDVVITVDKQVEDLVLKGWKPVDMVDDSKLETDSEFHSVHIQPYDAGERISYRYIVKFNKKSVERKIDGYKKMLTDTDYKVMKCYEASLIGQSLPYSINELHIDRQKLRDKINELEQIGISGL